MFQSLTFQKIQHIITKVDCQPMFDGGILINVLGQLKTDDDPPHSFSQTFVLKPISDTFFLQHGKLFFLLIILYIIYFYIYYIFLFLFFFILFTDIFRLGIHSA